MKKKLIALVLMVALLATLIPISSASNTVLETQTTNPFTDVSEKSWYYEYVMRAVERGLVTGATATTFEPNANITRAQFAVILYRYLGCPSTKGLSNPFTDATSSWYKDAVIYMASIGVVKGISDTKFAPGNNITREQMITMIYRLNNTVNVSKRSSSVVDFADAGNVSSWAYDAMNWGIRNGIISGMGNNTLNPRGLTTRAQAAKMICVAVDVMEAEQQPVTLRFWQAGGNETAAATVMRLLLDKFESQYPWITVEYQAIPWANDPHVQFQTGIFNGDIADLLLVGTPLDFQLAGEGSILPLDGLLSNEVKNDISDVLRNECIYHGTVNPDMTGKMMSVPLYGGSRAILYNKEIFDFFGVEYPTESMSHAELLEMARKLTGDMDGKKVYGFGTRATDSYQYLNFMWNYGAKMIDPATMSAATDSPEWKKGVEDYLKFYTEGVTPKGSVDMGAGTQLEMFLNGEIAMFWAAVDYALMIDQIEGWEDKLGIAAMPAEEYSTCACGADVLVIPAATEHEEEAALLLNYLMSTDAQVAYCKTIGFFPGVASAAADPYYAENYILAGYAANMAGAHYYGNYGVSTGAILRANMQMLLNGEVTIEQYQKNLTSDINAKIAEMYGY